MVVTSFSHFLDEWSPAATEPHIVRQRRLQAGLCRPGETTEEAGAVAAAFRYARLCLFKVERMFLLLAWSQCITESFILINISYFFSTVFDTKYVTSVKLQSRVEYQCYFWSSKHSTIAGITLLGVNLNDAQIKQQKMMRGSHTKICERRRYPMWCWFHFHSFIKRVWMTTCISTAFYLFCLCIWGSSKGGLSWPYRKICFSMLSELLQTSRCVTVDLSPVRL